MKKKDAANTGAAENNEKTAVIPRFVRFAVALTSLLLGILGISATFIYRIYRTTEASCFEQLSVETENAITALESNLRSDRTMLRVIAGQVGSSDDMNSIEVSGYLANYDINSLVTQIGIFLPTNEIVSSNGRKSNVNGRLSFETLSVKGEHISGSTSLRANSNAMMIHNYVPIRKDGICIGMLFSSANSASIAKAWLPSIYEKKGYCYVVNRKTGEVIINTSTDEIGDIHDISFRQSDPSYTKNETIENILGGKKGYSVFRTEDSKEHLYMCYLPFGIEDWEMVIFVPETAVFSDVAPIRNGIYLTIGAVSLLLAIYAVWLIHEIHVSVAETEQKANTDVLTGLPNRNRYEAYLKKLANSQENTACLFIDANGLHELNNSKGHTAGDQMLRFIADTLKLHFGGDHIYRIGGDEFVVFLSDKSDAEIDECLGHFTEALQRNDYHAAVGKCNLDPGMSVAQLIGSAEKNMYINKKKYYEQTGKMMRV